ncbi:hypothetical protein BDN72DRAFT_870513 [Pluteus cervinus]|uniref:Uncharacterized protein n=1 Tax=Pluteus cervinus TaxID=181527 RepID=A0ACD3AWP8_9AGAR|nr:hypothetical protein BDN72DRAFT_870513 [Pluteus cervinus]
MDVLFESFSRKEIISLTKHAHSPNHDDWNSRAHLLASLEQLSPEEKAKIQKIVEFERRRRGGEPAPQEGVGDEVFRWLLQSLTVAQIYDIAHDVVRLSRPVRRNRVTLMDFLLSLKGEVRETLVERCSTPQEKTGKRKTGVGADGETARKRFRRNDDDSGQTSDLEGSSIFPIMPEPDVNNKCISAFIKATGNEAMDLSVCVVCAREVFTRETLEVSIKELTRLDLLQPHKAHPAHVLRDKQLLYLPSLFPKKKGSRFWDPNTLHSGFRGNVATYPLNQDDISKMISTDLLPHPPSILSSVLAVTFVGPRGLPVTSLPKMLHIRRKRVHDALLWLKRHNHIYSEINISLANLNELPEDGPPVELTSAIHVSEDIELLEDEHEGYVPEEEGPIDIGGVIPIQSFGVVDVSGTSIPENDLMAHALANTANEQSIKEFAIRRGSAFVNEYARLDPNTQLRTDGGPSNTNHLLGAFPVLFPYGQGGFEVERTVNVPYEQHARWALQYCDRRFRQDMQFVFQVFGIMQKREICRNVKLQMSSPLYHQHQAAIAKLKASDLLEASKEESQGKAITNPAVRALRTNITAVRQKVQGTDESRLSLRSKVWSTTAIFGPPAIWMTINPSDTSDPIALKLVDQNVDLDNFVKLDDESNADRTSMVTNDPYASALYFHTVINIILEEMLGIRKIRSNIVRSKGILGIVQAYIAAREAQGRGSLHLHMLLTLAKMLSAKKIKAALLSVEFRERLKHFISATVKADLGEPNASAALAIPKIVAPAYSRPLDPSTENYDVLSQDLERKLARTVQVHKCSLSSCLRHVGNQVVCKRRAPFDIAEEDWIDKDGHWGPKRRYAYVNNFNPSLMQTVRANHDIKYIPNGEDTKDLTHYISNYAFKKQDKTSNSSALMADKLMYQEEEDKYWSDCAAATKKMLTRCANALTRRQELSAPETISYIMGWEDRYLSHHYVPIYLNGIRRYMKQEYPMLQSNV